MLIVRALGIWLAILFLAVANGALREFVLLPRLGNPSAQLLSGILLITCILGASYVLVPRLKVRSRRNLLLVGAGWLAMTVAFEFAFGRLVQGRSWAALFDAYTFRDGNLWPVVLVVTLTAPLMAGVAGRLSPDTESRRRHRPTLPPSTWRRRT
jgi:hypothetical protein